MAREWTVMARDFLGRGKNMRDMASEVVVMGKQNYSPVADHSPSLLLNNVATAGIRSSGWNKVAPLHMQPFLLGRGPATDERLNEKIAENLPEISFPRYVHPLQMQDLADNYPENCLRTQVRRQGDLLRPREEYGSSIGTPGCFRGSLTRTMISPCKAEAMTECAIPATSEIRLPSSGIQHDPPLTIFYAGSVNVFNNISAEQAEAIMSLASTGNAQSNLGHPMAAVRSTVNGRATPGVPHDHKSLMNLHSNQQSQANQVTTNMQLGFQNLNVPVVPFSPGPSGQPLAPTALPHARKASLARFLEKRRERAHSKGPYSVRGEDTSFPEERLSSSNDPTCYAHCSDCADIKKKRLDISSWMEIDAECSTSDVVVKEQKIRAI